jgi:uncharacterized protein
LEIELQHEEENNRFVVDLGTPGEQAVLSYRRVDENTLDFLSTLVPPAAREEGTGTALVRGALDWARERGHQIIPSCSFVEEIIERFPEYEELVAAPSSKA